MSQEKTPKPVRSHHLIALALVLAFVAQCCWFVYAVPLTQLEAEQVLRGVERWHLHPVAEAAQPPLTTLVAAAGVSVLARHSQATDLFWLDQHRWFIRAPFLLAGLCLALSLYYVARRLYGGAGGFVALALFAFSPGMVARSSLAGGQIFAAWGAFGVVFTAIATAHTLYAPREVILWNWKRIGLLAVAITFAVGSSWPLVWLLLPAAAFMLWAVPHRRIAAMVILCAGAVLASVALAVCELDNLAALTLGVIRAFGMGGGAQLPRAVVLGRMLFFFFADAAPGALLLSGVALAAWCAWRRVRFFGNTAPLIVFILLVAMGLFFPQSGASTVLFASVPFLLLFVAGVFADLIESRWQAPALVVVFAVIAAQAAYSVSGLMRVFNRNF